MGVLYKKSNINGAEPVANEMSMGEIAVNYNTNNPRIIIKDSTDNIVNFLPESKINSLFIPINNQLTQAEIDIAINKKNFDEIENWIGQPFDDDDINGVFNVVTN